MSTISDVRHTTLGFTFVLGANLNTQRVESSQFYIGYLRDAATLFEGAIQRLNHCEDSQCNVADATDMAHRIKGNAAMMPQIWHIVSKAMQPCIITQTLG